MDRLVDQVRSNSSCCPSCCYLLAQRRTLTPAMVIGKTAPRLINDLLDYDPRFREQRPGKNLLADAAPRFMGTCPPRKLPNECRHSLMKKASHTVAPVSDDELPDSSTKYTVPTYCSICRYHFEIIVDFTQWQDNHVPCRLSDQDNPLHHLQLAESIYASTHPDRLVPTKYDPTIEIHKFVCSSETCPLQVTIKVSAPRFSRNLLALLEPSKLVARGLKEIQAEPQRFEGLGPVSTLQALDYLRTYLRDVKAAGDAGPKRIAKRNKKFALAYSDECDALFGYLDFSTVQDEETEVSVLAVAGGRLGAPHSNASILTYLQGRSASVLAATYNHKHES